MSRRAGRPGKAGDSTSGGAAALAPDLPEGGRARWRRPRLSVSVRQASVYVAASLIYATLHFLFAGLPLSAVPLNGSLALSVQPAIVVPVFVGLTAGPLGGLLVGLGGRFLGDLLAGLGVDGFGLIYSGVLGLAAGLGYGRLAGYRSLRQVLIALGAGLLACALASLVSVLLLQTLIWRAQSLADGLNRALSQFVSGGSMVILLISTPLFVWDRTGKSESSKQ